MVRDLIRERLLRRKRRLSGYRAEDKALPLLPEEVEIDLEALPRSKKIVVVDLRRGTDYMEWHVPGAILMDPFSIDPSKLDKDRIYVFYSYRGELSRRIAEKLRGLGFMAYSIRGGVEKILERKRQRPVAS